MQMLDAEHAWCEEFALHNPTHSTCVSTFKKIIGVHPHVVNRIWNTYVSDHGFSKRDLLWVLSFLSCYCLNDVVMAAVWGKSETLFMEQVWLLLDHLYFHMNEVQSPKPLITLIGKIRR